MTVERAMNVEMDKHLGYGKYEVDGKNSGNNRKGYTPKTLKGNFGEVDIVTPRDRNSTFEPQIYLFIMIGLGTAMRRMEILSIKIKDIDLDKRIIYIPQAKAGSRQQPLTAQLTEVLKYYVENVQPEQMWLFPADNSESGHTMNIEKAFRRVVTEAGLDAKQVVRHTLRHTAITHLVQAGIDLPTVKRISGHKTLQMVERYSHQNGAHIQMAMDKLEERYKTSNL